LQNGPFYPFVRLHLKYLLSLLLFLLSSFVSAGIREVTDHGLPLEKEQYFVQIGAFASPEAILHIRNNYRIVHFINSKGLKIFIAGGYPRLEQAEALKDTLKQKGFDDAFVVLLKVKTPPHPPRNRDTRMLVPPSSGSPAHSVQHPARVQGKEWRVRLLLMASAAIALVTLCMICGLMISRIMNMNRSYRARKLSSQFEQALSMLLFEDEEGSGNAQDRAAAFLVNIGSIDLKERQSREVLLKNILVLHRDISGEPARRLKELYMELGLVNGSIEKLASKRWHIQAKGIAELTEMQVEKAFDQILLLTTHPNILVRSIAQLYVIRFRQDLPSTFLDPDTYPLTEWQQASILDMLLHIRKQQIPSFSRYLYSGNESIQRFAMKMIGFFHQLPAAPEVIQFMAHPSPGIKKEAIRTLGNLEAANALPYISRELHSSHKKLRLEAIKATGKLGSEAELPLLLRLLKEETDYDILMCAARAVLQTGEKGQEALNRMAKENHPLLSRIIAHVNDKRTLQ
jgi:HEAT repeat protein